MGAGDLLPSIDESAAALTSAPLLRMRSIASSEDRPQKEGDVVGWDEWTSDARAEYLAKRFDVAVSAIEEGRHAPQHVFAAQAALTSMRAELYGTPTGRARHSRDEARFDGALGEVVPRNEGVLK